VLTLISSTAEKRKAQQSLRRISQLSLKKQEKRTIGFTGGPRRLQNVMRQA
jgi:hypothetical protein